MTTTNWQEAEVLTRRIAQAGSLAVALALGAMFVRDLARGFEPVEQTLAYTVLLAVAMIGYAIAWDPRWELPGSVLGLSGVIAAFVAVDGPVHVWSHWLMLGVAAPAVLHLAATAMHQAVRRRSPV